MKGFWISLSLMVVPLAAANDDAVERGRYLVQIAACNDCHTAGYAPAEGAIPENAWLQGDPTAWVGPWGVSYAGNLRRYFAAINEDQWLAVARGAKFRPPMPGFTLRAMHEDDLRAIHRYIRHLGPAGEAMPGALPPGAERPSAPFVEFHLPPP